MIFINNQNMKKFLLALSVIIAGVFVAMAQTPANCPKNNCGNCPQKNCANCPQKCKNDSTCQIPCKKACKQVCSKNCSKDCKECPNYQNCNKLCKDCKDCKVCKNCKNCKDCVKACGKAKKVCIQGKSDCPRAKGCQWQKNCNRR